jgi:hypothetical protein
MEMQERGLRADIVQVLGIRLNGSRRRHLPIVVVLREEKSESPSLELNIHQEIRGLKVRIASTVHNPFRLVGCVSQKSGNAQTAWG